MRAPTALRSGVPLLALTSAALASCDGADPGPAPYTIPVVRLVGATIETGPGLSLALRAEAREVGRETSTCGGPNVDCLSGITVNPTRGDGTRVVFSHDVRLSDRVVPAGTDVYPLLEVGERLPFGTLTPFALRVGALPARLAVPEGTRVTISWTTVEGETITASAALQP